MDFLGKFVLRERLFLVLRLHFTSLLFFKKVLQSQGGAFSWARLKF